MRLLFLGFVEGYGGAQRMQILLANEMAERGHNVTLLTLAGDDIKYCISQKVAFMALTNTTGNAFKNMIQRKKIIKKTIAEVNPDLIINFWMQPAYLCAFMGRSVAKRTIYAERGDPYDSEYSGIRGLMRKVSFNRIGGFVFQTEGARDFFDSRIRLRSTVIINPSWVDSNKYIRNEILDKRIVTSGRLHPQKNQKVFIEAISKLPHEYDDYIAEIYGEGILKNELQNLIEKLNLTDRVFLRGSSNDVLNKIKDASVFVLTSDFEGIPNALIEAMTLGLPCVSTDCRPGGARVLIENEENGIIVNCGDADGVAEAIVKFLKDEEMARKCGESAKLVKEKTNPKIVFDKWECFFMSKIIERL